MWVADRCFVCAHIANVERRDKHAIMFYKASEANGDKEITWTGGRAFNKIGALARDDPKLLDDNEEVPKSKHRGWWFDS